MKVRRLLTISPKGDIIKSAGFNPVRPYQFGYFSGIGGRREQADSPSRRIGSGRSFPYKKGDNRPGNIIMDVAEIVLKQLEGVDTLTINDAADALGVTYDAVYKMVIRNVLPSEIEGKTKLVKAEAVRQMLRERLETRAELDQLIEDARLAQETGKKIPLLTTKEAARLARNKPNTVTGWIRSNKLTAERMGRDWYIHPADLKAFLEGVDASEETKPETTVGESQSEQAGDTRSKDNRPRVPLLTSLEAAQQANVKPNTLAGWIRSGKLPAHRRGRDYFIHPDDLRPLIRENEEKTEDAEKAKS